MALPLRLGTKVPFLVKAHCGVCVRPSNMLKLSKKARNMCSNQCQSSNARRMGMLGSNDGNSMLLLNTQRKQVLNGNVRTICGRENCKDPCDFPRCSPENLKKTECMKEKEKKDDAPKTIYEVYWDRPECCNDECVDAYPRFDDLYYQESDKENRIYTQTWVDCPPMVIKPRALCCTQETSFPPLCKRPRKERPKTACDIECRPELEGKCPKIKMPCCRQAMSGQCLKLKLPSGCKKFMAPSPSFSECRKGELRGQKPTECWCIAVPSMCSVWEEWRKLQRIHHK